MIPVSYLLTYLFVGFFLFGYVLLIVQALHYVYCDNMLIYSVLILVIVTKQEEYNGK